MGIPIKLKSAVLIVVLIPIGCGSTAKVASAPNLPTLLFSKEVCRSSQLAVLSENRKHLAINDPSAVITLTVDASSIEVRTYDLGQYNPYAIAISPDGRFIVGSKPTGSDPGRIFLIDQWREDWSVDGLRAMAWTPDDPSYPYFSADGKHVFVADYVGRFTDVYGIPDLVHREITWTLQSANPRLSPNGRLELVKSDQRWGVKSGSSTDFLHGDTPSQASFLTNQVVCGRGKGRYTLYDTLGNVLCVVKIGDGKATVDNPWGVDLPADQLLKMLAER